jgi:SAM-dependent methyltransferase
VERLPLPTGAFHGVVSLDVIEHVNDVAGHLEEIDRIAAPGARLALSTPNRFSLAPEPHVGVLGVGWLPRPLQARYVRWRAGLDYRGTALLSSRALCAAIRRRTGFSAKVLIPPISPFEIRSFRPAKRRLAMAYNRVHGWPAARWFFLALGPFFRLVGVKPGPAAPRQAGSGDLASDKG